MTRGSSVYECFATPMTSYSFPLKWRYTPGVISRSMLGRLPFKRKQARQIAWPVTYLAEEVGFEPTVPCGTTVFKTAAFNHSAIPPKPRKHTTKRGVFKEMRRRSPKLRACITISSRFCAFAAVAGFLRRLGSGFISRVLLQPRISARACDATILGAYCRVCCGAYAIAAACVSSDSFCSRYLRME